MRIAIPIQELRAGDILGGKTVEVIQRNEKFKLVLVDFSDGTRKNYEWDTEMIVNRSVERI